MNWRSADRPVVTDAAGIAEIAANVREPVHVVRASRDGAVGVAVGGELTSEDGLPHLGTLPPIHPEWLGDRSFCEVHRTRFPYVTGAMANGIATTRLVIAAGRAGFLGFFGAAGLGPERVEAALHELREALGDSLPWGSNLIHSPNEPDLEERIVELYLEHDVRRVSASAYMALTPAVVRYSATGLTRDASGWIRRRHHVFAKISRPETARRFLEPAPADILTALVERGHLTAEEAALAAQVPVAEDIIVESDSGGHTDNQALGALFPTILGVRDDAARAHGYARPIRVGAAGGLGTPTAVASAFALGAAFVLTGSVNQGAVESGLSETGRRLLANADLADVVMAPAADMFELGVKVQVLRRGTMFGVRALRLYELYSAYDGFAAMPAEELARLERDILRRPWGEVWSECERFFGERDPRELARASREPRHQMALVFRWYLGLSSRWAIAGEPSRAMDYQIWCGPAMGSFNRWARGSFLEAPEARTAVQIGLNLLEGAAVVTRAHQLRSFGVPVPGAAFDYRPRPLATT